MHKTEDAFALRGLYEVLLESKVEGWLDAISNYLKKLLPKYEIRAVKSAEDKCRELEKYFNFVLPRIEVECGNQVLKRIERHIGRLKSYSQKILADVLAKGFNETLRDKGNRVNELISNYEYIADLFKKFCDTAQERRDEANEKFQKEFRLEFGRRLKQARKATKLTQQQLAELVGLKTFNAIAQYERGISDPSLPTLYRLSKELNCSADWLLSLQ